MLLDLNKLYNNDKLNFEFDLNKDLDLDNRIYDLKDSKVVGSVYINSLGEMVLEFSCVGTMYIIDSISLDLVPYNFNINFEENLDEIREIYCDCYEKGKNTLDLKTILWQNIVLEVPISYTIVSDAELKGNGWELVNSIKKEDEIDPRLRKLEDLLKGDD